MKAQLFTHKDIKRAHLYEHDNGRQVLTLTLVNDLELRFAVDGGKATISGFLDWGTPDERYIQAPIVVEDKVGL